MCASPPLGASRIHRHATNREVGLLFGRPRDPIRAVYVGHTALPSISGYTYLPRSPGETYDLPRVANPGSAHIRSTCIVPELHGALRLHVQHHIQPPARARAPRALAHVRFARRRAVHPLCGHAAKLSPRAHWHSGTDGCIDNCSNCARASRFSSVGACGRCTCALAPRNGATSRDVVRFSPHGRTRPRMERAEIVNAINVSQDGITDGTDKKKKAGHCHQQFYFICYQKLLSCWWVPSNMRFEKLLCAHCPN